MPPKTLSSRRKPRWMAANELVDFTQDSEANDSFGSTGTASGGTAAAPPHHQQLRSMNMSAYGAQQPGARHTPRLQNTQKSGIGNGAAATTPGAGAGGWGAGGFGMPSSGTAAFAGLGGAPGLGAPQGRPGQLSGFAQVMGGGGGQAPIDMSDFPSLAGGPRSQRQGNVPAAGWNSNAIRQPTTTQPTQQAAQSQQRASSTAPSQQSLDQFDGQRSQQSAAERSNGGGGGDEFPPLGGQVIGDAPTSFNGSLGSPDMPQSRSNGPHVQLPIRDSSNSFQQAQQTPIGPPPAQSHPQTSLNGQAPPLPGPGVKPYGEMTEDEKWGLPGLMAAYEARRQAESGGQIDETLPPSLRSAVVMGQELSQLGLDLDSPDPLYPTFTPFPAVSGSGSAFDFHDRHMVPDFTLPPAYQVNNVPPLASRMSAFSDETLFSVFYQHPRDVLQELAASELYNRDWRWHKVLRQWLQKDSRDANAASSLPLVDMSGGAPIGTQHIRTGEHSERGVYVFLDAMNWRRERREFGLDYEQLDSGRGGVGAGGASAPGGPVMTPSAGGASAASGGAGATSGIGMPAPGLGAPGLGPAGASVGGGSSQVAGA